MSYLRPYAAHVGLKGMFPTNPQGSCTASRARCLWYCSKHETRGLKIHLQLLWPVVHKVKPSPWQRGVEVALGCKERSVFTGEPSCPVLRVPVTPWVLGLRFANGSWVARAGVRGMHEVWGDI